jgi:hypothetical protein
MPNTKNHQFLRNLFSSQSNGGGAEAGGRFGRQDKGRISSAPTGTPQPAPHENPMRPHPVSNGATRSKNSPKPKRQTVHLTIWVDPIVKGELQRIAKAEGLTVSKTGAAFLKQALQNNVNMQYSTLLTPIIETAIDKRMRARDSRQAWLLTRNVFASEHTRNLVTNILGIICRQQKMSEENLKTIIAMTKQTAKGNLTRKNPELEELIEAVKKWLDEEQDEPSN